MDIDKAFENLDKIISKLESPDGVSIDKQLEYNKISKKIIKDCDNHLEKINRELDSPVDVDIDIKEDNVLDELSLKHYLQLIEDYHRKLQSTLTLDDSIKLYNKTLKIINLCEEKLSKSEDKLKVKKLINKKGNLSLEDILP